MAAKVNKTMKEDFARLTMATRATNPNTADGLTQASNEAKPETIPQLATHPNEAEASTASRPQTGFFDLPYELRDQIYNIFLDSLLAPYQTARPLDLTYTNYGPIFTFALAHPTIRSELFSIAAAPATDFFIAGWQLPKCLEQGHDRMVSEHVEASGCRIIVNSSMLSGGEAYDLIALAPFLRAQKREVVFCHSADMREIMRTVRNSPQWEASMLAEIAQVFVGVQVRTVAGTTDKVRLIMWRRAAQESIDQSLMKLDMLGVRMCMNVEVLCSWVA